MSSARCPRCGWPEAEPFEIVSRHDTSEGTVVYTRCACGRLQVRNSSPMPVLASRGAALPRSTAAGRPGGGVGWWVVGALLLTSAAVLPAAAVAAGSVLFAVAGMVGWAWAWLTGADPWPVAYALRVGVLGAAAVLVIAALAVVLDAAVVAVLPVVYLVAGLWFLAARARRRPCP